MRPVDLRPLDRCTPFKHDLGLLERLWRRFPVVILIQATTECTARVLMPGHCPGQCHSTHLDRLAVEGVDSFIFDCIIAAQSPSSLSILWECGVYYS